MSLSLLRDPHLLSEAVDWPVELAPGKGWFCCPGIENDCVLVRCWRGPTPDPESKKEPPGYKWLACRNPAHRESNESDRAYLERMATYEVPTRHMAMVQDREVLEEVTMAKSNLGPRGVACLIQDLRRAVKLVRANDLRDPEWGFELRVRPSNYIDILAQFGQNPTPVPVENVPRPRVVETSNGERKVVEPQSCWCGCEGMTKGGRFLPGHDAKLKGRLTKMVKDTTLPRQDRKDALAEIQQLGWERFVPQAILEELGV